MEKYNKWQEFWDNFLSDRYGKKNVETERDLYFQVARTLNRQPIDKEVFRIIIDQVIRELMLSQDDLLVDLCCGNGLFTYEWRNEVARIIGVDFSQNIIDTANAFKNAPNISYCLGNVVEYMHTFPESWPGLAPTKYIMNDSLAYFSATDLEQILTGIASVSSKFMFLIRGVPNDELKWNYYNTEERRLFYEGLVASGDLTNYGLGTWWQPSDIKEICERLNMQCVITNEIPPVSDYRMDIMVSQGY